MKDTASTISTREMLSGNLSESSLSQTGYYTHSIIPAAPSLSTYHFLYRMIHVFGLTQFKSVLFKTTHFNNMIITIRYFIVWIIGVVF